MRPPLFIAKLSVDEPGHFLSEKEAAAKNEPYPGL